MRGVRKGLYRPDFLDLAMLVVNRAACEGFRPIIQLYLFTFVLSIVLGFLSPLLSFFGTAQILLFFMYGMAQTIVLLYLAHRFINVIKPGNKVIQYFFAPSFAVVWIGWFYLVSQIILGPFQGKNALVLLLLLLVFLLGASLLNFLLEAYLLYSFISAMYPGKNIKMKFMLIITLLSPLLILFQTMVMMIVNIMILATILRKDVDIKNIDCLLTDKGRAQKARYSELKGFLAANPLVESRLANEYESYAIAFGLRSLGIPK